MNCLYRSTFVLVLVQAVTITFAGSPPPCFSEVFCHGPLLHTVQMARIFNDSKTFVDMKMRASPNQTLAKFSNFMEKHNSAPKPSQVKKFVEQNFEPDGQEFLKWNPKDWVNKPKFLDNIKDGTLKKWGQRLNDLWKLLGRQIKEDVRNNPELYSMIWVPHPVIVPGGRFREFYYWDSYWIIQGLLLSEMHETAKGMLENFIHIVNEYGHVPNGGRIYYMERSQPPLLIPMVKLYVDATKDTQFIATHIKVLEREFSYWMRSRTRTIEFKGKNYTLAMYGEGSHGPRPESYVEDVSNAKYFQEDYEKEEFYSELKAAAESGWDFSSRWFIKNKTNQGNLTHTKIRSIVPVDLNSIIYWNAVLLQEFHEMLGNELLAEYYKDVAEDWLDAVTTILWHEDVGAWLDYDLENKMRREYFYPSNIAPLWTGCYPKENKSRMVGLVLNYLESMNISSYVGGMPTSFQQTGEQWDYPNVWPPLQHILIVGLNNTGEPEAMQLAERLATSWILINYKVYNKMKAMYEKYDAIHMSKGEGGEYEVQLGFGWTNGIVMYLLNHYGSSVTLREEPPSKGHGNIDSRFHLIILAALLESIYFLPAIICACLTIASCILVVIIIYVYRKNTATSGKLDPNSAERADLIGGSSSSKSTSNDEIIEWPSTFAQMEIYSDLR